MDKLLFNRRLTRQKRSLRETNHSLALRVDELHIALGERKRAEQKAERDFRGSIDVRVTSRVALAAATHSLIRIRGQSTRNHRSP